MQALHEYWRSRCSGGAGLQPLHTRWAELLLSRSSCQYSSRGLSSLQHWLLYSCQRCPGGVGLQLLQRSLCFALTDFGFGRSFDQNSPRSLTRVHPLQVNCSDSFSVWRSSGEPKHQIKVPFSSEAPRSVPGRDSGPIFYVLLEIHMYFLCIHKNYTKIQKSTERALFDSQNLTTKVVHPND